MIFFHFNTFIREDKAEKRDVGDNEQAFAQLCVHFGLKKSFEYFSNVFLVLRGIAREHKDIIQVKYDCYVKVKPEQSINIGLKGDRGVC